MDEPHGVVRASVVVFALAVDGDDPGMLEVSGDLGLEDESRAARLVGGDLFLHLLERDLAMQLLVAGDEHAAQPTLVVQADDLKPAAGLRRSRAKSEAVASGSVDRTALPWCRPGAIRLSTRSGSARAASRAARQLLDVDRRETLSARRSRGGRYGVRPGSRARPGQPESRAPFSTRISLRLRDFSSVHEAIASIRASREMKSIWSATMPRSRFRSDDAVVHRRGLRGSQFELPHRRAARSTRMIEIMIRQKSGDRIENLRVRPVELLHASCYNQARNRGQS